MMQSASDIFLGWTKGEAGRHFYVRQLKDMKIKPMVELFTAGVMLEYARLCGWTLAHAHARSGEPAKISGYLGKSDAFDQAIGKFALAYADQNERDHAALAAAVKAGHGGRVGVRQLPGEGGEGGPGRQGAGQVPPLEGEFLEGYIVQPGAGGGAVTVRARLPELLAVNFAGLVGVNTAR